MRDRTAELKSTATPPPEYQSTLAMNQFEDIELGEMRRDQFTDAFFRQAEAIKNSTKKLEDNLSQIQYLYSKILSAVVEDEQKEYRDQLQSLIEDANRIAQQTRASLKDIEKAIDRSLSPGSADYRMCHSQQSSLATRFRGVIFRYQDIQRSYRDKQKARFERQYKIVNPDASEDEINRVLDENYAGPIFAQSIMKSTMMEEAQSVLKDVQVRHDEIIVLAKSILELQSMFDEMSDLVTRQDDIVNQITFQMSNTEAYTGQATQELAQAVISAKKVRARKWCLAATGAVLITALVLVIVFIVVPKVKEMTRA